jgi:hypothetical protein
LLRGQWIEFSQQQTIAIQILTAQELLDLVVVDKVHTPTVVDVDVQCPDPLPLIALLRE